MAWIAAGLLRGVALATGNDCRATGATCERGRPPGSCWVRGAWRPHGVMPPGAYYLARGHDVIAQPPGPV